MVGVVESSTGCLECGTAGEIGLNGMDRVEKDFCEQMMLQVTLRPLSENLHTVKHLDSSMPLSQIW